MVQVFCCVDYSGAAHLAPVVVDEDVAHYCEDPSLEVYVVDIF